MWGRHRKLPGITKTTFLKATTSPSFCREAIRAKNVPLTNSDIAVIYPIPANSKDLEPLPTECSKIAKRPYGKISSHP